MTGADRDGVVAAAGAALGVALTDPTPVGGGSDRSLVLRARAGDRRVVVKAPTTADEGPVRELAALRVLTAAGVPGVPRLLAEAADPPLLVLTDLGAGPSLADALLGSDPAAAQDALDGWATALGRFQAATTGLRDAYAAELAAVSPLGPPPADRSAVQLAETAGVLARLLPRLGVTPSEAALAELRALVPGGPAGLTPGDTCPDNNVRTGTGYALLDFEGAEFRSLAWEAAYLRVPFPTCWCAWALPADAAGRALSRWRAELDLPAGFDAEVDRATVAWAFVTTGWFLPRILAGSDTTGAADDPAGPPGPTGAADDRSGPPRPMPTRRALVHHRLATAPATGRLADLAAEIAAALLRTYGDHPLGLAPAFRPPGRGAVSGRGR